MKALLIAVLPVLFLLTSNNSAIAQVNNSEIKIKVEFHCNGGKAKIERELLKIDGISAVTADLETKIVTIKYDSAKQTKEKLVAAIENTGHKTEFTKKETVINSSCASHGVGDKKCDEEKK